MLEDLSAFAAAVSRAVDCAREGALVTFGVTPDRPETGYGYIEKGDALASGFAVRRFVEKPAREAAEAMLAQGGYFWNSGMFVFRASQYLAELEVQAPAIMAAVRKAWALRRTDYDFIRLHGESFARCPSDSVDYALMEKSARVAMVPLPCRWSDLGSWEAVYENSARDAEGNACVGDVLAQDSRGCYIHPPGDDPGGGGSCGGGDRRCRPGGRQGPQPGGQGPGGPSCRPGAHGLPALGLV